MSRTYTYHAYHPHRRRRQLQIGAVVLTVSAAGLLPLLTHPVDSVQTPLFGQTTPLSQHSALAPSKKGKGGSKKRKDSSGDSDSGNGSDSSSSSSSSSDSSNMVAGAAGGSAQNVDGPQETPGALGAVGNAIGAPATAVASPVGNATSPASSAPAKSSGGLTMLAAPPTESAQTATTPTAGGSSPATGSAVGGSLPVSAPAAANPITNTATSNGSGCQQVSADQLSQALNSARPGELLCLSGSPSGALPQSTATAAPTLPQVAPSTSPAAAGTTSTGTAPTAPVAGGDGGSTWTMHMPFLSGCYTVPNTATDKSGQAPKQVRVCGSDSDSGSKR